MATESKGKIERGVGYVRGNFWVRVQADVLAQRLFLPELNLRAREWAEGVANLRVHGTHGEVVLKRYLEETPLLGSLDGRPRFDTDYHEIRRVSRDGRLSYKGQLYQVSLQHALSEVEVSENLDREVTIRTLRASRADGHQRDGQRGDQKGEGGEVLRFELIEPGLLPARQVVHRGAQASERQEALAQEGRGVSIAELLRAINADALDELHEPVVEARDLSVYEEVARAVRLRRIEERVRLGLERLHLGRVAEVFGGVSESASRESLSYLDFLDQLLQAELVYRYEKNVEVKTRLVRLPYHKTMNDFDYSFQPSVDKKQIADLLTLQFLERRENVLLLGPPGVGKSHIAVALALETILRGHSAYFVTMQHLIDYLSAGMSGNEPVSRRMGVLIRPKLLVIDEVGYLPLDRQAANWFFELVSRRYERGSIVL